MGKACREEGGGEEGGRGGRTGDGGGERGGEETGGGRDVPEVRRRSTDEREWLRRRSGSFGEGAVGDVRAVATGHLDLDRCSLCVADFLEEV